MCQFLRPHDNDKRYDDVEMENRNGNRKWKWKRKWKPKMGG